MAFRWHFVSLSSEIFWEPAACLLFLEVWSALFWAYLFQKTGRFLLAYLGEVVGTGIIGGTLCYPVAVLLMGKDVALFFYVLPFLMSTACGTAIAFLLIEFMRRIGLFSYLKRLLDAQ